ARFLSSLQDPVATLSEALDQTVRGTPHPPNGETLEEVLRYLLVMPPVQAREVVTVSVRMLRSGVAWVLRGLLHARNAQLRDLALAGIMEIGDAGAAAALDRAARESHDPEYALRVQDTRRQLEAASSTAGPGSRDAKGELPPI